MRVRTRWVATSLSPNPNQAGSAPYAASSALTVQVSPARPQPRSASAPPPRVYMTLSRSGQIRSPCSVTSSPTLTIAVTSAPVARTPARNRAPPIPPASTTIRMPPILPQPRRHQMSGPTHCGDNGARLPGAPGGGSGPIPYQGGVVTTQPPIPTHPAAPAAEQKDPVAITAPLREWAALIAVIAPLALQFFTLIVLLFDSAPFAGLGGSFSDRANATFGDFVSPLTIFLPLVGVLLATHVKPPVAKAKLITLLALIGYGVAALLRLVTMFAAVLHPVGLDLARTGLPSVVTLLI